MTRFDRNLSLEICAGRSYDAESGALSPGLATPSSVMSPFLKHERGGGKAKPKKEEEEEKTERGYGQACATSGYD